MYRWNVLLSLALWGSPRTMIKTRSRFKSQMLFCVCQRVTVTCVELARPQSAWRQGNNFLASSDAELFIFRRTVDTRHAKFRCPGIILWRQQKLECGPMPNVMVALPNRWRPLFNAAKFGWRPLLECRAVTLPRRETSWNLQGCPKLTKWSQPLAGWSSPYCEDM